MARVKRGVTSHAKHKKVFKADQGLLRPAQEHHPHRQAVGGEGACNTPTATARPRSARFRALWIQRLNAAVRPFGLNYSRSSSTGSPRPA